MEEMKVRQLELLAPACNPEIAKQAILHGADAVYIGGPSHGARKAAYNTLDSIAEVVDFSRSYRSKVYVTVNTVIYDNELKDVRELCRDLYRIGVDALIVQDMALLRLGLPPIPLHASTQCDIRTPEKARFLQEVGFSQIVLARELTIPEIKEIVNAVDIPVECFVHGALCVSYSGRCHASLMATGRSANRGECAQLCRLPYDLYDANGKYLAKGKHLLSLRDFNAFSHLEELVDAGVGSFKIEGRLKEKDYVKNITGYYSRELDRIISNSGNHMVRTSFGTPEIDFEPNPGKSFNRGFTDYFLGSRRPESIASLLTPKSMGETVSNPSQLNNGDGISYFNSKGEYEGANVIRVDRGRIITNHSTEITDTTEIHRTSDIQWQKMLSKQTAVRRIDIDIKLTESGVEANDERGVKVNIPWVLNPVPASRPMDYKTEFSKTGNSVYRLKDFSSDLPEKSFIPKSKVSETRRQLFEALDIANLTTMPVDLRRKENREFRYPYKRLDYRDNVSNELAKEFYADHGVEDIEPSLEKRFHSGENIGKEKCLVAMTTRHCVLRELGMCKRLSRGKFKEPLHLSSGTREWRLHFNCADCEMEVIKD